MVPEGEEEDGGVGSAGGIHVGRSSREGAEGGAREADGGGDGHVRRPPPLHQHDAVHGGGEHVGGEGRGALSTGRPPPFAGDPQVPGRRGELTLSSSSTFT